MDRKGGTESEAPLRSLRQQQAPVWAGEEAVSRLGRAASAAHSTSQAALQMPGQGSSKEQTEPHPGTADGH